MSSSCGSILEEEGTTRTVGITLGFLVGGSNVFVVRSLRVLHLRAALQLLDTAVAYLDA